MNTGRIQDEYELKYNPDIKLHVFPMRGSLNFRSGLKNRTLI